MTTAFASAAMAMAPFGAGKMVPGRAGAVAGSSISRGVRRAEWGMRSVLARGRAIHDKVIDTLNNAGGLKRLLSRNSWTIDFVTKYGSAVSIKSLDPTAGCYQNNPALIQSRINDYARQLSRFAGQVGHGPQFRLEPNERRRRVLLIVVPGDLSTAEMAAMRAAVASV